MLHKYSGQVAYTVLNFGGLLGIGEGYRPVSWRLLIHDTSLGGYVVDITRERLERAKLRALGT
ncbi:hypothetical protein JMJ56_22560 [Belnapia sp. T18]|uniref:Uncharacterized protein n=1 Tax=Belnapia arida TaxID=2804533 RepID=A0ABS1UC28_9PROT|nr:hypothetical protein [Belnapia arida]